MNLPTPSGHVTPDGAVPYASFVALKAAHAELLQYHRQHGETAKTIAQVDAFIRQGAATGSLLDPEHDRQTAQSLLVYWVTMLYRSGAAPTAAATDEHAPPPSPASDHIARPLIDHTLPYR